MHALHRQRWSMYELLTKTLLSFLQELGARIAVGIGEQYSTDSLFFLFQRVTVQRGNAECILGS